MEFKLKTQEQQTTDRDCKTDKFKKYNDILQDYIQNMTSEDATSVNSTSEFNTTNCKFL